MTRIAVVGCLAVLSLGCGRIQYEAHIDAGADAGPLSIPPLGLYMVNVDGTGLSLLLDTGTRQLAFAEQLPGTEWIAATRFNVDVDGNGLAMALESSREITGTDVVLFPQRDPTAVSVVSGGNPTLFEGYQTWTGDGRLLFVGQDVIGSSVIRRATFTILPNTSALDTVPVPGTLVAAFSPHQIGPSDARGTIFLAAVRQFAASVSSRIWSLSAAGTTSIANVTELACPRCGAACCTSPAALTFGASFPRVSHAGRDLIWLEQDPSVSFGMPPQHPPRPRARSLAPGSPVVDLTPAGMAATSAFGEVDWRDDDREVVSWYFTLEGTRIRSYLYRMAPDGTNRQIVPLPEPLCPFTATYMTNTRLLFSAYRCRGAECSCDESAL